MIKVKVFVDFHNETKILRAHEELEKFINKNNITRNDIIDIKFSINDNKGRNEKVILLVYEEK